MHRRLSTAVLAVLLAVGLAACDAFSPRSPELPTRAAGTFLQPNSPDDVIINIQKAVEELNVQNYRRSLSSDIVFRPTATAQAGTSAFIGWGLADEERYFSTLVAASDPTAQHNLRIEELVITHGTESAMVDGVYILTVSHNRSEVPQQVQGRLLWTVAQDADGLWRLKEWADQELGSGIATWSTLKAEFGR